MCHKSDVDKLIPPLRKLQGGSSDFCIIMEAKRAISKLGEKYETHLEACRDMQKRITLVSAWIYVPYSFRWLDKVVSIQFSADISAQKDRLEKTLRMSEGAPLPEAAPGGELTTKHVRAARPDPPAVLPPFTPLVMQMDSLLKNLGVLGEEMKNVQDGFLCLECELGSHLAPRPSYTSGFCPNTNRNNNPAVLSDMGSRLRFLRNVLSPAADEYLMKNYISNAITDLELSKVLWEMAYMEFGRNHTPDSSDALYLRLSLGGEEVFLNVSY